MKKFLALAAVAGGLALGVPAALAATDAPDTVNTPVQSATPTPDQTRPDNGDRGRDGHLCPEDEGNGGSQGSAAPAAPEAGPEI